MTLTLKWQRNLLTQAEGPFSCLELGLKVKEQASLPICLWLTHLSSLILFQGEENLGQEEPNLVKLGKETFQNAISGHGPS